MNSPDTPYQSTLVELSRQESDDLDACLSRICQAGAKALDVARVGVWLFNDAHTTLRCLHLVDRQREAVERGAVLEVGAYPRYFETLEHSRTIAATEARTNPATSEFATGYLDALGIVSMLDVPIRQQGRLIGVVCHEHCGAPRVWQAEEQHFAASIADLVALGLERGRRLRYTQRLKMIREIDRAILAARSMDEVVQAVLPRLREIVPFRRASVALFDGSGSATLIGVLAPEDTRLGAGSAISAPTFGDVEKLRQGRPYTVDRIETAPATPALEALAADGVRSFACIPLRVQDELIEHLGLVPQQRQIEGLGHDREEVHDLHVLEVHLDGFR